MYAEYGVGCVRRLKLLIFTKIVKLDCGGFCSEFSLPRGGLVLFQRSEIFFRRNIQGGGRSSERMEFDAAKFCKLKCLVFA